MEDGLKVDVPSTHPGEKTRLTERREGKSHGLGLRDGDRLKFFVSGLLTRTVPVPATPINVSAGYILVCYHHLEPLSLLQTVRIIVSKIIMCQPSLFNLILLVII